jgi:hypothetical protein
VIVFRTGEQFDDAVGDFLQQGVVRFVLPAAVREGVPYLLDQGRMCLARTPQANDPAC